MVLLVAKSSAGDISVNTGIGGSPEKNPKQKENGSHDACQQSQPKHRIVPPEI